MNPKSFCELFQIQASQLKDCVCLPTSRTLRYRLPSGSTNSRISSKPINGSGMQHGSWIYESCIIHWRCIQQGYKAMFIQPGARTLQTQGQWDLRFVASVVAYILYTKFIEPVFHLSSRLPLYINLLTGGCSPAFLLLSLHPLHAPTCR